MNRRRSNRILALLLAVLPLATASLAQAGTWRCDTGEICIRGAASCCPPGRGPSTCGGAPMSCCGAPAATAAGVEAAAPAGPGCCSADRAGSTAPGRHAALATAQLPHSRWNAARSSCTCHASYRSRGAGMLQRFSDLPVEPLLRSDRPVVNPPLRAIAASTAAAPPLRPGAVPPLGGRSPPAC